MKDRIIRIVSQIMNVPIENLNEDSSPDTVTNWDSLKHMNLILALEENFAVTFSDDEVIDMLSVKKIVEILGKKEQTNTV
ncbi:MAG: acyl carrier protein [Planctomycetes bacterium]|nr:acyl carrier protein [Planctomycetota bacterium]